VEFRSANILLIEDNPADARFTQVALEDLGIANRLTVVTDGEAALNYLYGRGTFNSAARPDCILLDWNLPKADGSEVLEIIRRDSKLATIPVVVLSGSREQTDVIQAYHLKANGYVTKPIDLAGLQTIMECCEMDLVLIPRKQH
jgi:two-component system response regulator